MHTDKTVLICVHLCPSVVTFLCIAGYRGGVPGAPLPRGALLVAMDEIANRNDGLAHGFDRLGGREVDGT